MLLAIATAAVLIPMTHADTLDTAKPTLTITAPSTAATSIPGMPGGTINVTGTATDNIGVHHVEVVLNGGPTESATLTEPGASTTPYSLALHPVGGPNVLQIQSFDGAGNTSAIVTRRFSYVVKVALTVNVTGSGTVKGKLAGATYQVGKTYTLTATPAGPGTTNIFNSWTGTGITSPASTALKLSFLFTDALALNPIITAAFVTNPFIPGVIGKFDGLVRASIPPASNENSGFITMAVTASGSFTGTLKIDRLTLPLAGLFDNSGHAVFGTARASTVAIARAGKAGLVLSTVTIDLSANGTHQITGSLGVQDRDTVRPWSTLVADRAAFSPASPVPPTYTANKGYYTVIMPAQEQENGLVAANFPQGAGIGSITLTPAGLVTLTGVLADGTPVTASAPLSATLTSPLFAQIYASKSGSFSGLIKLDETKTDHDLKGSDFLWFKPYTGSQSYPYGWPEGVSLTTYGAKYATVTGTPVLVGLTATASPQVHNAMLSFAQGGLVTELKKTLNISPRNVVTRFGTPADPSYSLALVAATGKFSGTFTHSDSTKPSYSGIIYQKGALKGGYGYFLAPMLKVVGAGLSGPVSLNPSNGPAPVNLRSAGTFVLLSKSGVTNVPSSNITGDVGTSPITGAAIDLSAPEVTGIIYTADAAGPDGSVQNASKLTTAVGDMQIAYNDAAGRLLPDHTELGAGLLGGMDLSPGLYKWSSPVAINSTLTLSGGADDVWIFQIASNLSTATSVSITLSGGAQAKNIFWQVAGETTLEASTQFKGIILCQTKIVMKTGASLNGRAMAQTAVTLDQNSVTAP